jgi:6-phosphogluconolactonase
VIRSKKLKERTRGKPLPVPGRVFQEIAGTPNFLKGLFMMQKKGSVLLVTVLALAGLPGCNSFFSSSSSASHAVYVTVPSQGIVAFRVNNKSGDSSAIIGSPFATGNSPFAIQVHPSKQFLYVSNASDDTISTFKIDGTSGALTELSPRTLTRLSPQSLAMDSAGSFLYVGNETSNNLSVFSINPAGGALTEVSGSPFSTCTGPNSLVVSPTGKYLYVLCTNLNIVAAYAINSGMLQEIVNSPFQVGAAPFALAIDPTERFMYVINAPASTTNTGTVSEFTIGSSGALTLVPDSAFPAGTSPVAALVHPTGNFLYVANNGSNNISEFSIDPSTGVLTELSGETVAAGTNPVFMAFDDVSGWVDVGNQGSKNVTQFSVNQTTGILDTGMLTAVNSLTANDPPTAIAFGK